MKKSLFLLSLLAFHLIGYSQFSSLGRDCNTAFTTVVQDSANYELLAFGPDSTELWVSFVPTDSVSILVSCRAATDTVQAQLTGVVIYENYNNCDSLVQVGFKDLATDSDLDFLIISPKVGATYSVKYYRNHPIPTENGRISYIEGTIFKSFYPGLCWYDNNGNGGVCYPYGPNGGPGDYGFGYSCDIEICEGDVVCLNGFGSNEPQYSSFIDCNDVAGSVAYNDADQYWWLPGSDDAINTGDNNVPNNSITGIDYSCHTFSVLGTYDIYFDYNPTVTPTFGAGGPNYRIIVSEAINGDASFTIDDEACQGESPNISFTGSTNTQNTVSVNGVPYGSIAQFNANHVFNTPGTFTITVDAVSLSSCAGINDSQSQTITIRPAVVLDLTVDCHDLTIENLGCVIAQGGAFAYQWNFGDGVTANTSDGFVQHTFTNSGTYNGNVIINGITYPFTVVINVEPPKITGITTICCTNVFTYTVPNNYSVYNWQVSGGTILSGQNTNSITVDWTLPISNALVSVELIDQNGCIVTSLIRIRECETPVPTELNIEISECGPNGYTLTASSGFDTYVWSDGQTGQTITVSPNSTTTYTLTASNSNSECDPFVEEINLQPVNPNIDIIGTEYACENNGTSSFLATNYNPLYTYNWSVSGNASGTVTTNPNVYEVQFGTISGDYTLNLHVVTNQGCNFFYSKEIKGCCSNVNLDCISFDESVLYSSIPILDYKVNYTASRLIFENGGNTTIQGGGGTGVPVMSFQGDLIIDTDITFQGRFMFGENSGIIVQDGVEFSTVNQTHLTPCDCNDEMWNGILLEANGSKLDLNGARVHQAKAAVTSVDGAEYIINGCNFRNCYKGLVVNEYPSNHTGLITYSFITSKTGDLIAPYVGNNSKTAVAIEVNNVENIEIGINNNNPPFTSLGGVQVKNARNGFVFTNSNAIVRNSILENCYVTASTPTIFSEGHGILSTSNDGNTHILTVEGTNQNEYSTFKECNIGLMTMGDVELTVKGNRFNSIYKLAGIISFGNSANIEIFGNKLDFGATIAGIYLWNVPNTTANVSYNQLNYSAGYPGGNTVGIAAENFGTVPADINIFSNQIKNCFSGIYVNNIPETEVYNNTISLYIDQNSVNNSSIELNGITVSNATDIAVKNNDIRRFSGTPNSDDNLNGIRVENCAQALVQQNTIRAFGKGINVLEANPNALFYCNTLQKTFDGFSFLNAEIGNQGFISGGVKMPQNNRWLSNINQKLTGDLTTGPIDWIYKNGGPFSPSPENVQQPNTPNYQLVTGGGILEPCLYLGGGGPKKMREDLLGRIVRNEKSFQLAEDEFLLANRNYALKKLLQDTALLYLGEPDDVDYQDFVATYQNATVGKMCEIDKLIQQKYYAQALAETSSLTNHAICENIKTTHQIFHNTWANEWYHFSEGQIDTLQDIACQSGLMAGKSVYDARALLGWFNNCDNLLLNKSMGLVFGDENSKEEIENAHLFSLYPNPSSGIITIEYDNIVMNAEVYIYSITGAIVKQVGLQYESNITTINMTDLNPGVYFLSIKKEFEQLFNEKIVIVK